MAELRVLEFREKTHKFRSKGSCLRPGDLYRDRLKMSTPNTARPTSPHRPWEFFNIKITFFFLQENGGNRT